MKVATGHKYSNKNFVAIRYTLFWLCILVSKFAFSYWLQVLQNLVTNSWVVVSALSIVQTSSFSETLSHHVVSRQGFHFGVTLFEILNTYYVGPAQIRPLIAPTKEILSAKNVTIRWHEFFPNGIHLVFPTRSHLMWCLGDSTYRISSCCWA